MQKTIAVQTTPPSGRLAAIASFAWKYCGFSISSSNTVYRSAGYCAQSRCLKSGHRFYGTAVLVMESYTLWRGCNAFLERNRMYPPARPRLFHEPETFFTDFRARPMIDDSPRCHWRFRIPVECGWANGAKLIMGCRLLVASVHRGFGTQLA
jgi:hypothetical protein